MQIYGTSTQGRILHGCSPIELIERHIETIGTIPVQGISMKIYPFPRPTFLVSMGYIDPAKWVIAIEDLWRGVLLICIHVPMVTMLCLCDGSGFNGDWLNPQPPYQKMEQLVYQF